MQKSHKTLFLLLSALICTAVFSACVSRFERTPETPKSTYTVVFNSGGGSTVTSITRIEGSQIAKPADPTKDGNIFDGWFYDFELTTPVGFPLTLDKDYILYAKWGFSSGGPDDDPVSPKLKFYTVTFDTGGASAVIAPMTVEEGGSVAKPADPVKTDFVFGGWYKEATFLNPWVFGIDTVTQNMTLYAKWEAQGAAGTGTQADPINLYTAAQLTAFAAQVNAGDTYSGKFIALRANIDLGGVEWTPIATITGTTLRRFSGNFNGNGFEVRNFKITPTQAYAGFFANNSGTIQNLRLKDFTVNAQHSNATVTGISYTTRCYAGGLVGYNDGGKVISCSAEGSVKATATSTYGAYAGVLAGGNFNGGEILGCSSGGSATAAGYTSAYAGGLVGRNEAASIQKSSSAASANAGIAAGTLTGVTTLKYAGGFVGYHYGTGAITDCYASGNATAESNLSAAYAGGFVGYVSAQVSRCYASGDASAVCSGTVYAYAGGFAGFIYSLGTLVTNCFAAGNLSSEASAYSQACAAGFSGNDVSGTNSYRYAGQTFTRKYGSGALTVPFNTAGALCSSANLNDPAFYTETLDFSAAVWDLANLNVAAGKLPTLK
ncbi:MAG: InlB B-repeat-containing protein [Firmicutes bacterium]|nr:InlB B-repeat-containing protein [Bacillota bacterium]